MSEPLDRLRFIAELLPAEQLALLDSQQQLSYWQLIERVEQLSEALCQLKAKTVGFRLDNSVEWVLIDLACQAAGCIALPLPPFFSEQQCRHCLDLAAADLLLEACNDRTLASFSADHWRDCEFALEGIRARRREVERAAEVPEFTQKITFTSGSTGNPKGVCLSLEHQWQVAESLTEAVQLERPRHLCLLPLATLLENIAGIYSPLLAGGCIALPTAAERGLLGSSGIDSRSLFSALERWQPHTLILIPQLLQVLVQAVSAGLKAPASLRFIAVGGARVAPELLLRARELALPVYEGYGLSECGSVVALNTPAADRPGSCGRVLAHCKVGVVDGHLQIESPCHLGYLGDPSSWQPKRIDSGDLAEIDSDGFVHVHGRAGNLIITSFGRNVSPEWIESELQARPIFSQCVVVGSARPHLSAILSAPAQINDQDIQHWIDRVNQQLPDYARVGSWLRLPAERWQGLVTANGRPRRREIEQQLSAEIDALYAPLHASTTTAATPCSENMEIRP